MEFNYSEIIVNGLTKQETRHGEDNAIIKTQGYPVMCLSTEVLDILLCIKGYQVPSRQGYGKNWCKVDIVISAEGRINICKQDRECLLPSEIDGLLESINRVRTSETDIYLTEAYNEPDMTFDLTNVGNDKYNREVSGRWDVAIDKYGVSSHYISIKLSHKNIELLRAYLLLVTGRRSKESFEVNRWILSRNIIV